MLWYYYFLYYKATQTGFLIWNNITHWDMQKLRIFFYLFIYIFIVLREINGLVSTTFTLEKKSGFTLERNKDLTCIVIIVDIDWYEINYRDHFLGHIAQPYDSVFQFLPISSNFAQPLKRSGPTFHRPQSTNWSALCEGDVLHCMRQMVVTDTDPPPPIQ